MKQSDEHRDRLVELGDLEDRKQRLPEFGLQVPERMLIVPAGGFLMGTADSNTYPVDHEQPQGIAYLDAYAIDVCPVTVAQYRTFCEAKRRKMPEPPSWGWLDDNPIVNVTWHDASAYCKWAGERLPTEAEWEKAARGTDGRIFPWGSEWNERAAHCDYHHKCEWSGKTAPVGSHPQGESPYGCHDMVGNVCEWCADRWGPENPRAYGRQWRVSRGGAWGFALLRDLRCERRFWTYSDHYRTYLGFRCARDLG